MIGTAMMAYLDSSPSPKTRMNSGNSALFGIGNVASMRGWINACTGRKRPIASPRITHGTTPRAKPIAILDRLTLTCVHSPPLLNHVEERCADARRSRKEPRVDATRDGSDFPDQQQAQRRGNR